MSDEVITVTLGGEEHDIDAEVASLHVEGLPFQVDGGDWCLVVVEGEEQAESLEKAAADSRLKDAIWSSDVGENDHEFIWSLSVVEFVEKLSAVPRA